jgi:hypothetical protein
MRTGQDYDFWLRISDTWGMVCLPDVLYTYCWHPGMASIERKVEQARNAEIGRVRAVQRRLGYARLTLGLGRNRVPQRLRAMSRRQLAECYTWWSAGARALSRKLAFQFLVIALLLDPSTPEIRAYFQGIVARKLGLDSP